MGYDNWKLQTPPEGKEGLYAGYYRIKIEELAENESVITEMIVEQIERIKRTQTSTAIPYEVFGGGIERNKDILKQTHRLNYLKAFQLYLIEQINKYKSYLEE